MTDVPNAGSIERHPVRRGSAGASARPGRGRASASTASTAAAAAAAAAPGLGVCYAYLFVEYGRPMDWIPGIAALRPGLLVGIWGIVAVAASRQRPFPRPVLWMFGLMALMAVHVPLAMNNRWALWGLEDFTILMVAGVLPLALLPMSLDAVRSLLTVYVLMHVPTAINGLMKGGRGLSGWMGDENDLALALNAAIGAGVYLLFETRSVTRKLVLAGSLGLLLAAVVSTRSRGGFVGLVMLVAYLIVAGPHRGRIVTLVLLGALGLMLFAPPAFWDEIATLQTAGEPGDTGDQRLYFWGMAWEMFLDHPIIGVGTNNYGIRTPAYMDPAREGWASHPWGRVAHSLYFTVIAEWGLAGIVMFGAILLWCFRARRRFVRRAREVPEDEWARRRALIGSGMIAGLVSVLATGAFLSVLLYPVHWGLIGLLASLDAMRPETVAPGGAEAGLAEAGREGER